MVWKWLPKQTYLNNVILRFADRRFPKVRVQAGRRSYPNVFHRPMAHPVITGPQYVFRRWKLRIESLPHFESSIREFHSGRLLI